MSILRVSRLHILLARLSNFLSSCMTKHILPVLIVILGVGTLGAIAYGFANGFTATVIEHVDGSPTVFFQRGVIATVDKGGNPLGSVAVYRVDGFNGRARQIFHRGGDNYLLEPSLRLDRDHLALEGFTDERDANGFPVNKTTTILDLNGNIVSTNVIPVNDESAGWMVSTLQGSEYEATTRLACIGEPPKDEPCRSSFRLSVRELTSGSVSEFRPSDFGLGDGAGLRLTLFAFSADQQKLLVSVGSQQEFSQETLYEIGLLARKISVVLRNYTADHPSPLFGLKVLDVTPDRSAALVARYLTDGAVHEVVRFDLTTYEMTPVTGRFEGSDIELAEDQRGVFFTKEYNRGLWNYDFTTQNIRQVVTFGNPLYYSRDRRFIAIINYRTVEGYNPQQLYVLDAKTGKSRLLCEARTSDEICRFVGIL